MQATERVEFLNDPQNFTGYSQVIRETHRDGSGQLTKEVTYTFGLDELSQTTVTFENGQASSPTTVTFAHDGHGSVRALLDAAGAIATVAGSPAASAIRQLFTYDAYGNAIGFNMGAAATVLLYSGEQFDQRIQMQYLRARFYDAANGRFVGLDPYFGNSQDPLSFHKYLYTHANPIRGIDPSGMMDLMSLLSSIGFSGNLRQSNTAGAASTMRTAQQAHKTIKMFQQVIKVMDKVSDIYEMASDIVDLLSLDPSDLKDLFFQAQSIRNAALGTLAAMNPLVARITIPQKVLKKLGTVTRVLGSSDRAQEIIGEFGGALVLHLMGFSASSMKRAHGTWGPDTMARYKQTNLWGIFEAKGGGGHLGNHSTLGGSVPNGVQEMGKEWIGHWIEKTWEANRGHADATSLRTAFQTGQPMIAVVTSTNLRRSTAHIKIGFQVYVPPAGFGFNQWVGF